MCTFINNSAPYGNNLASVPVKLISNESQITVASGQSINQSISVSLLD